MSETPYDEDRIEIPDDDDIRPGHQGEHVAEQDDGRDDIKPDQPEGDSR